MISISNGQKYKNSDNHCLLDNNNLLQQNKIFLKKYHKLDTNKTILISGKINSIQDKPISILKIKNSIENFKIQFKDKIYSKPKKKSSIKKSNRILPLLIMLKVGKIFNNSMSKVVQITDKLKMYLNFR